MNQVALISTGAILGLSVAAPIGPMGQLCINRTLANGLVAGLATGAGATSVQLAYTGLLLISLDGIAPWFDGNKRGLSAVGAGLLLVFALRLFRRTTISVGTCSPKSGSVAVAYASALLLNLANPMTVVLLLGSVASMVGPARLETADTELLLTGQFFGSMGWWASLTIATSLVRRRAGTRLLGMVNRTAALSLLAFSLLAAARVVSDLGW